MDTPVVQQARWLQWRPALDPSPLIPSDLSVRYLSAELKSPVQIPTPTPYLEFEWSKVTSRQETDLALVRWMKLLMKLPEGRVQTRFAKLCQVTGPQNAHRAPRHTHKQFPKP